MAKKNASLNETSLQRTHRITVMLNDREMETLQRYLKKYRISNKSEFVRRAVMEAAIHRLMEDAPTLFD